MYHTLIDPRICSDVNGEYWGADNQIHQTKKFDKRTIFSGWDVFRSQMPLQTLINPTVVNDLIIPCPITEHKFHVFRQNPIL